MRSLYDSLAKKSKINFVDAKSCNQKIDQFQLQECIILKSTQFIWYLSLGTGRRCSVVSKKIKKKLKILLTPTASREKLPLAPVTVFPP
jgi:hypothetical protein